MLPPLLLMFILHHITGEQHICLQLYVTATVLTYTAAGRQPLDHVCGCTHCLRELRHAVSVTPTRAFPFSSGREVKNGPMYMCMCDVRVSSE